MPIVVLASFVVYVAMHSPLRGIVAEALGTSSRGCYLCVSTPSPAPSALPALLLVFAAVLAAASTTVLVSGRRYERPMVFGLLLAAFATVPPALIAGVASALGTAYLRPPVGPLLAAIPALLVAARNLAAGWRPRLPLRLARSSRAVALVAASAAFLLTASAAAASLHPPSQGDALSYHAALAVFIWEDGNLTAFLDRSPGKWGLAHPGTAEIWFGLLRLIGGERLANLGQVPFALVGAGAVYAFTRRTGLLAGAGKLAAASFLLMPMVALEAPTQANDVMGASFVMVALALTSADRSEWTPARSALVGIAVGLAAATKLGMLPGAGLVAAAGGITLLRRRPGSLRMVLILGVVAAVVVAPWWLRNLTREGNPVFPQALPLIGRGVNVAAEGSFDADYVPTPAAWPVYPLFEPIDDRSGYGPLFLLAVVPGSVFALRRARRRPLIILTGTFLLALPIWWRYTVHEPRFLLPFVGMAATLVPWALAAAKGRGRQLAAATVVAAAMFSVVISLDQQVVPLALQPTDRTDFYDEVYGVAKPAVDLPSSAGVLQLTGLGHPPVDYASTYPLLGVDQQRLVIAVDRSDLPPNRRRATETVVDTMRRHELEYAYVQAVSENAAEAEALFPASAFAMAHQSWIAPDAPVGARRRTFRHVPRGASEEVIVRYLFRLAD